MKIEKINDNQIRCTLTKEDLASRQLKLSELAYGSDKARELFRDMIKQASNELGFETDDIPLMVEAIPLPSESIILLITKVECPEELDTRFSKFSEGSLDDFSSAPNISIPQEAADSILGLFKKISEDAGVTSESTSADNPVTVQELPKQSAPLNITKVFSFRELDTILRLAHVLKDFYEADNVLYKNPKNGTYYLVVTKGAHTPEAFNKVCNILSEYGTVCSYSKASEAHFKEQYEVIVPSQALQVLGTI